MTYPEALAYLYSFADMERVPGLMAAQAGFDLDKVHRWFDILGRPEHAYCSILVAGTKGKGSTANYLAGALQAAGYRTGLYTSPHLTSFRERLQIDGAPIPAERLAALVAAGRPAVEQMHREAPEFGRLTTFELATGLALCYFAAEGVDYAVLEIGLGGRLDPVNAVRAPLVSVITAISRDHTRVLGETLDKIAYEKAGILKAGIPAVTAPQPPEAAEVIVAVAAERGAPLYTVGADVTLLPAPPGAPAPACTEAEDGRPRRAGQDVALVVGPRLTAAAALAGLPADAPIRLALPLRGAHQAENAATALAAALLVRQAGAARLDGAAIREGFGAVRWPGRLEVVRERPLLLLDGAHNDASAAALAASLPADFCYRRLILIVGVLADKDAAAILRPLLPLAAEVIFTQSRHPRALSAPALTQAAAALRAEEAGGARETARLSTVPDVAGALALATRQAAPADAVCVTGSLSIVGDARAALGLGLPIDPL